VLGHESLELRAAQTFGKAGRHDDRPALLDDGKSAGQTLDRLVPGRIERIAGTAGDNNIQGLGHWDFDDALDEADAFFPGPDHVAGADPGNPSPFIETNIDDEV